MASDSIRSQIARLAVGESYSKSSRLNFDSLTREDLLAATESLRTTLHSPVRRAQEDTGHSYNIEVGEWRTRTKDIVITVIVTRQA